MTDSARPYLPAPGGTLSRKTRDALFLLLSEFAPKASSELVARLGLPVKIEAKSLEVVIGAKHQIEKGISLDFNISPGGGRGFLGIEIAVARALVEASFQGGGTPSVERDITPVERRVTEGFMEFFLSRFNAFWEKRGECAFAPIKAGSSDETKVSTKDSEDTFVIALFQLNVQGIPGRLEAGLPLPFLKPLTAGLEKISEKPESMADDPKLHPVLKKKMEGVLVPIRAFLAEPDVFLREMADLEPGDVLPVGRLGAEAVLLAGVVPMFRGQAGVLNGHRAIRISGVAKTDRRVS
ncbi:MAG: FliM/FliN family flagellar motor switch protein [Elusimicrobia bacterium]|nr:FliM/FliN family flagellar motor switch protein [Elusimicrobiota bacterium]